MTDLDLYTRYPQLTKKQRAVAALLVTGMTNKEMARELEISPRTVEDHRHQIYRKLGVRNVAGLFHKIHSEAQQ